MTTASSDAIAFANRQLLRKLLVITVLMFGFGYALVPFYDEICRVTGVRDLFKADEPVVKNTQVDYSRKVSLEFDANTQRLGWTFHPLESHVEVHPGQVTQVIYEVRNTLDRAVTGQAVPSYGPQRAAQYFQKLECFCFQQQTLGPGEVRKMPVVFVIDPAMPKDLGTVTLSYTFFEVAGTQKTPG
jgi:cytochrome c oxidase assembly protein subunit 11